MGAINYKTSKYITIALKTDNLDFENEEDFDDYIVFQYEETKEILKKYNFNILQIETISGYYEGFSINIDFDFVYFDNTTEKNEALKEATQLKKFLIELLDIGLFACFPGWCTTFLNYEETRAEIKKAIKNLKNDIKNVKTYLKYKKEV